MKALLLSAQPWNMTDDKTGEIRTGTSLHYAAPNEDAARGFDPVKISGPLELFDKLKGKLPAVGELVLGTRRGKEGKATVILADVVIGKPLDLKL